MKTKIKVSETIEVVAISPHGVTIQDTLQKIIIAIVPEELDDLIEALNKARFLLEK